MGSVDSGGSGTASDTRPAPGKAEVLSRVCGLLAEGDVPRARSVARAEYPFAPAAPATRRYNEYQALQVFWRDGFVDRYSGTKLVFPGTLRLLGQLLPDEFPMHPKWKLSESHFVFWELFPTVDHVIPVSRGGVDAAENWVTTSMLRNIAKSSWTLAELGWALHPTGDLKVWDGLTKWFLEMTSQTPALLSSAYLTRWRAAALRVVVPT